VVAGNAVSVSVAVVAAICWLQFQYIMPLVQCGRCTLHRLYDLYARYCVASCEAYVNLIAYAGTDAPNI
jgi:hypothetical protein